MYEAYWGLTEPPFALTPDPRFLYSGQGTRGRAGDAALRHHAQSRARACLMGDIGLGKTTVSRKLIEILDPVQYRIALIVNPISDADSAPAGDSAPVGSGDSFAQSATVGAGAARASDSHVRAWAARRC
jgi:type II secretory pathway predicted ATPase ExeA